MKKGNVVFVILGLLFFFNILAWIAVYNLSQPRFLEVTFFDVGQGDSIFIETPQDRQILIDGGPSSVGLEKLSKAMPFWDRTIDAVILTHPEQDHMQGLIEVLRRYKVNNILWTGVVRDTAEYATWIELLQREKAKIYIAKSGQTITCAKCRRQKWALDILFPFQSMAGESVKKSNNTSIVAKLTSAEVSLLFTGDIEKAVERQLAERMSELNSDVLKVAHHGSKTSSSPEFVAAVSPQIAVISVGGDNKYGHPHPNTLGVLEQYGVKILRTDLYGDIRIIIDGTSFSVK